MTNLITEARELCGSIVKRDAFLGHGDQKYVFSAIIPKLCDALESAQEQNKQLMHEVCRLACESVEREKTLARLEVEVMAACNSVRWVPVTERLPEKPAATLILWHSTKPIVDYAVFYGEWGGFENIWVTPGTHVVLQYVTHWQPLPAPPEEGAEHERD